MNRARQSAVIQWFCAAALAAVGCAGGTGNPVSPSSSPAGSMVSASFPRGGDLHVTKECSTYTGAAGDVCTITSSNVTEFAVGSTVVYAEAANFSSLSLDSDVVLDVPGPGNNTASGHCQLNLVTGTGRCTFSGGTGKFTHFQGSVNVSHRGGPDYAWDGTYSFDPRD